MFKYSLVPQVTEGIDCLTPEDIMELDAYCRQRYIDFVPNQNCFGHMHRWLAREEYKHLEVGYPQEKTGTINPLLEEANDLVDMIFDSLLPYYDSEYVNIGLDEAFGLGKFQLEDCCREHGSDNVFLDYLNRLSDRIGEKYNKKVQFWADMITSYPDSFYRIPKGSVALEWGYEVMSTTKMEKHCKDLKSKGVEFYVCPSVDTYLSLTGRFDVASFNLRTTAEIGRNYGAKGYLVTDWHYEQDPQFGIWSFLPAAVGGQYSWNVEEEQKQLVMETYFERRARDFLDFFFFEGKSVSEQLQRLANYFLLEPERVRLGTMCGMLLPFPMETTSYGAYFDIKDCGDDFYFDNVVRYVEGILVDLENLDMDQQYKREIVINAKIIILSAKLCKVRLHMKIDAETLIVL